MPPETLIPATVSSGELILLVICLCLSAFFSATETALTALSKVRSKQLVADGHPVLQLWVDRPVEVLTTILIGNNLVNVLASAMAGVIAERLFADWGLTVAVTVMTLIILMFGEITPKTYAKLHADRVGPKLLGALLPFFWLCKLFTPLFIGTMKIIVGDLDVEHQVTEAELEAMILESRKQGELDEHSEKLLNQVLDLDDTSVREAMVPRTELVTVKKNTGRDALMMLYGEHGHTRMPVIGASIDDIVGVLHIRDMIRDTRHQTAGDAMREPNFVSELQKVNEVLKDFQRRRSPFAVVVDEYGGTAGCLAMEDIVEVIVGDIRDEYEEEEADVVATEEGVWMVDGSTKIDDLSDEVGHEFEESEEYDTLAGLVTVQLGRLPEPGDGFELDGFNFLVCVTDDRRIETVEVRRPRAAGSPVAAAS
jgi:putative hemolysin